MSRIPVFVIWRCEAVTTDPTFENSTVPSSLSVLAEFLKATISFVTSTYLPTYLSTNLFIYLSTHLPIHPSIHLPTYLPIYIHNYLHIYLSTYLPIYLPIYLSSTYLSTYLPTYLCPFVLPSGWNNSAPSGRIFIKFDTRLLFDNLLRKCNFL